MNERLSFRTLAFGRYGLVALMVTLFAVTVACGSSSDDPPHYVTGTVLNASTEAPIVGATVIIEEREGGGQMTGTTGTDGTFNILVGNYHVDAVNQALNAYDYGVRLISADGYETYNGGTTWQTIDETTENIGTFNLSTTE